MTEKRLTRSRIDHKLGGVCGGIAEYLDVDATLIRVLAVLAILVTLPVSLVAYVVLWAVIPEAPLQYAASRETTTG